MPESTAKKLLLSMQRQSTPDKILVTRDINAWMQTQQKQQKKTNSNNIHWQVKNKIARPIPKWVIKQNTYKQKQNQGDDVWLPMVQLKKRREDLMKSISIKKRNIENTKDTEVRDTEKDRSSSWNRDKIESVRPLMVHVNQFQVQENGKKQIIEKILPAKKFFIVPKTSPVNHKKESMRKFVKKMQQKQIKFQSKEKRGYKSLSNEVSKMVKQKLLKNNYTGLLTSISRKTCNVLISFNLPESKKKK